MEKIFLLFSSRKPADVLSRKEDKLGSHILKLSYNGETVSKLGYKNTIREIDSLLVPYTSQVPQLTKV